MGSGYYVSSESLAIKEIVFATTGLGPISAFSLTGEVSIRLFARCKTNCAIGAACDVELGIPGNTAVLIPTTDASLLASEEWWHDVTPDSKIELSSIAKEFVIADGRSIDLTLSGTGPINSGSIVFYCYWAPLSDGATVIATP